MNAVRYPGQRPWRRGQHLGQARTGAWCCGPRRRSQRVRVRSPDGRLSEVEREPQNTYTFTGTERLGVYDVFEPKAKEPSQRFAVNLFDAGARERPAATRQNRLGP